MPRRSQTKKNRSTGRSNSGQPRSEDIDRTSGRSSSRSARNSDRGQQNRENDNGPSDASAGAAAVEDAPVGLPVAGNQNVAAHVRQRQRAVAEREAARLALPERRAKKVLAHSSKAARTSTPFGTLSKQHRDAVFAEDAEWCGPFSVARQMIAAREEAKRKRLEEEELEDDNDGSQRMHHPLDAIMKEIEHEQKKKSHPSMQWKSNVTKNSTPSNMYAKRQKLTNATRNPTRVPTLAQLCVSFVVDNFDFVESLGDVDNDVRLAISKELVGRNELDDQAFQALVSVVGHGNDDTAEDPTISPAPPPSLPQSVSLPVMPSTLETLEIVDCAGISHDCMAKTLEAVGESLRYLLLTNAGRCFGVKSVKALMKEIKDARGEIHYTPRAQLQCISITGAYLLKDEDAARLVTANAGTLQSIAFETCPLLGPSFVRSIQALHTHQVPTKGSSNNRLLELALTNMNQFSTEDLQLLTEESSESLKSVRSLTLQNLAGLTDDLVASILAAVGLSLDTGLDLSHNHELTDATLSAIRQFNPRVKTLVLDGLKGLTAAGLEALFTPLVGMSPPPKLKVLKVASVHHEAVTDEVMKLVLATRMAEEYENDLASVNRSHHTGLVQLDVSGSSLLTDSFLEALAETSIETLEEINVVRSNDVEIMQLLAGDAML